MCKCGHELSSIDPCNTIIENKCQTFSTIFVCRDYNRLKMVATLLSGFSVRSSFTVLAAGGFFCCLTVFLAAFFSSSSSSGSAALSGVTTANTKFLAPLLAPVPVLRVANIVTRTRIRASGGDSNLIAQDFDISVYGSLCNYPVFRLIGTFFSLSIS